MSSIYEERFVNFLKEKHPDVKLVSVYVNAKTKIILQYKCGCTKEIIPSNLQSRGNGSKCLIHTDDRIVADITHTSSGGLKDFNTFFNNNYTGAELVSEYKGSHEKVTIKYKECGCETTLVPTNMRTRLDGKYCRLHKNIEINSEVFINLMKIRHPNIEVLGPYINGQSRITIRCNICKDTWKSCPNSMHTQQSGTKCHTCNPIVYTKSESEIYTYIKTIYSGWVERNDRTILEGKELDIVLPDLGLAFEYNGVYWHSDKFKDKSYHADKTNAVKDFGYQLIHIMEDEWVNKQEIVKSRILSLIGKSNKIFARKCLIKEVPWPQTEQFLNNTHLRGPGAASKINLGLYYEDELVAIQTFSTPKTASNYEYELVRYSSKLNTNIVGGASKLLRYFINTYKPKGIVSYSDRRWSTGNLYKTLGFEFTHTSPPGYTYYKGTQSFSRYKFQKHKLKELFPDIYSEDKTEASIMEEAGYYRVYDCGNDCWVIK